MANMDKGENIMKNKKVILWEGDETEDNYRISANIHFNEDTSKAPLKELEILSERKIKNKWEIDRSFFLRKDEAVHLARIILKFT